jgi:hypothetical protein
MWRGKLIQLNVNRLIEHFLPSLPCHLLAIFMSSVQTYLEEQSSDIKYCKGSRIMYCWDANNQRSILRPRIDCYRMVYSGLALKKMAA